MFGVVFVLIVLLQKIFKGCINTLGRGCSKLTTSLVNVLFNFQKLISQICQYFLLKKCQKLLQAFALQKLLSFIQKKISVHLVIKS